jgi:hypothetical protein
MKSIYAIIILLFAASSCTYDQSEKYAFDALACDTTNVRFSVEIKNILDASCLSCHADAADDGGGYSLDSYEEVKNYVDQKRFLESIERPGINYMPRGGAARLSTCKINQIKSWINKGAPNN